MFENKIEVLSGIFFFDSLSKEQLNLLWSFVSIRKSPKGELIFSDGEKAVAFYGIVSGRLKLYRISQEGQEHILEVHSEGDLVAEAAIFDTKTYPVYCEALEDSILVRIPTEEFIDLIMKHPDISIRIMNSYSKRLRFFVRKVEELSLRDVKSRLAGYLMDNKIELGGKIRCNLPVSKKELAGLIGTIPETLSRTLNFFRQQNIISVDRNSITIVDLKKLKTYL